MALLAAMGTPNTTRLSHLKLDGFRWGGAVLFCPECDFQYDFECVSRGACPNCDKTLQVIEVTLDLVKRVMAAA
jgi:hypothetical protein